MVMKTIKGLFMKNINPALMLRIEELLKENNITEYRLQLNSEITYSTLKNIMHDTVKDNLLSTVILIRLQSYQILMQLV